MGDGEMIKKCMLRYVSNQRGESQSIFIPFLVLILAIFIYIGVDVYGYIMTKQYLKDTVNETLDIAKAENGFDSSTRASFDDLASKYGLNPNNITIQATPKTVQRGSSIEIRAHTTYEVHALRPFGQTITMPVDVYRTGFALTYIR
ncbi:DUF4320 family protein [Paenibacillus sp. S3N08]|uniref:DUF4320 family protein n=1 Tax=Paenibacillus agricola TaxID=2716264 RepID=A0ABX0JJY8_9BACL|nr:DUF4320 family protein [Paenibacillus agricola]